jgi:hypothetical protein
MHFDFTAEGPDKTVELVSLPAPLGTGLGTFGRTVGVHVIDGRSMVV